MREYCFEGRSESGSVSVIPLYLRIEQSVFLAYMRVRDRETLDN